MNTQTTLPTQRKNGRHSKFVPATRARLVELIAKGVPYRHATAAVRISYQTFCNYREQHPDFREEIERATSEAIEKHLDLIIRAAESGDVASSRFWLERVHSPFFSRSRLEVTGADGSPLAGAVAIYLPKKDGEEKPVYALAQGNGVDGNNDEH